MTGYTPIDYAIVAIFFSSMLAGLMRGFLKEVLSLASWIVAGFVATTFASPVAAHFSGNAQDAITSMVGSTPQEMGAAALQSFSILSIGVSFSCIFMAVLLAGSIATYIVTSIVTISGLGIFNRILGAGFGFARGYLMAVVFVFLAALTPITEKPMWQSSQLAGVFAPAARWLADTAAPGWEALKQKASSVVDGVSGQAQEVTNTLGVFAK